MKGTIHYTPHVDWLENKGSNVYTQFGEDGLIDGCLQKIGETNQHCFEIGAADGLFFSNTLRLREEGWKAVLIEADADQFSKLDASYGKQSICLHGTITDLDAALLPTGLSRTPDLGIIDIDGQDYWMWHDLVQFRPRVMLVEIFPSDRSAAVPARGGAGQAGRDHIRQLGLDKGYTMVAETHCNALFVETLNA